MKIKRKTRTVAEIKRIKARRLADAGKAPGAPTGVNPRSLARSVAKANLRRAGASHVNKLLSGRRWLRWFSPAKSKKQRAAGKAAQA